MVCGGSGHALAICLVLEGRLEIDRPAALEGAFRLGKRQWRQTGQSRGELPGRAGKRLGRHHPRDQPEPLRVRSAQRFPEQCQLGGLRRADEPIDRRVFELVDGRLAEFSAD